MIGDRRVAGRGDRTLGEVRSLNKVGAFSVMNKCKCDNANEWERHGTLSVDLLVVNVLSLAHS
jgi:hypothetical protein